MKLKKLLLLILIVNFGTVCAQNITLNDSCICYTDKQDINCLECLIKQPLKDSLIVKYKSLVYQSDSLINFKDMRIQAYSDSLTTSKQSIALCKDKRKKSIRNGIKGSVFSFIIGFIIGLLI